MKSNSMSRIFPVLDSTSASTGAAGSDAEAFLQAQAENKELKAQVARERDEQHGIERSVCELGRMRQRTLQLVRLHSNMKFLMRRERRAYTAPMMEITKEKTSSWCSTACEASPGL